MKFTRINELTKHSKPHNWLIKGIIESNSVGLVFGKPESGKSLLTMDMAFCVASGLPWKGHKVKRGDVFYVAGEGFEGIGRRFKALEVKNNIIIDNVFMSEMPTELVNPAAISELAEIIKAASETPALIVFDTLHRNFGGGDENSSRDFGLLMNNIDTFIKPLGAAIVFVHHSGHGTENRSRGSSSINGSLDVEYSVSKDNNGVVSVVSTKAKEFQKHKPQAFKIEGIDTGWLNEDGERVFAPLMVETDEKPVTSKSEKPLTQNQQCLENAFAKVMRENPQEVTAELKGLYHFDKTAQVANIDEVRQHFLKTVTVESKGDIQAAKRAAFTRTIRNFYEKKKFVHSGELMWRFSVFQEKMENPVLTVATNPNAPNERSNNSE